MTGCNPDHSPAAEGAGRIHSKVSQHTSLERSNGAAPTESAQQSSAPPIHVEPRQIVWGNVTVPGLRLETKHPTFVQNFQFTTDGLVLATSGDVNGPQTAPIYEWHIKDNALILTSESHAKPILVLTDPVVEISKSLPVETILRATSPSGARFVYKVIEPAVRSTVGADIATRPDD